MFLPVSSGSRHHPLKETGKGKAKAVTDELLDEKEDVIVVEEDNHMEGGEADDDDIMELDCQGGVVGISRSGTSTKTGPTLAQKKLSSSSAPAKSATSEPHSQSRLAGPTSKIPESECYLQTVLDLRDDIRARRHGGAYDIRRICCY
jgi:hypothetical protein